MPIFESSAHGDLFVEYNVVLPATISQRTRRSEFFYYYVGLFHLDLGCLVCSHILFLRSIELFADGV
jgi:hypothetical protein